MSANILKGVAKNFISLVYLLNSNAGDFLVKKLLFQPPEEYIEDKSIIKNAENCWIHIKSEKTSLVVVFLHGNASDISMNRIPGKILSELGDVYIPEYAGYGTMGEKNTDDILCYLRKFFNNIIKPLRTPVLIIGQSLGSHFATRLASEGYCTHLCLISPFYSIERLAFANKSKLVNTYNTSTYIQNIKPSVKITIMHGDNDQIIPPSHSRDLYHEITKNPKRLCIVGGHCHNSINFLDVVDELY